MAFTLLINQDWPFAPHGRDLLPVNWRSALWFPADDVMKELDGPHWLGRALAGVELAPGRSSGEVLEAVSAPISGSWIIMDEDTIQTTALEGLADWSACLKDDTVVWIRFGEEWDQSRGGKPRWRWFVALASRQGFDFLGLAQPFAGDRYCVFRKATSKPARWRLQAGGDHFTPACRELFQKVFEHAISPEFWAWKYGEGRGRSVIALRDDRVIAHYGCTSRRVVWADRELMALQICDVMVDPTERAVMTRNGVFFQIAQAAQESFIGLEAGYDLGYGFPNDRHMRLAHRQGLYDEVERLVEIEWSSHSLQGTRWTRMKVLGQEEVDRTKINRLWHGMRASLADKILVVRDADYWAYRYLDHPQHQYSIIAVSQCLTRRLLGLAVLRRDEGECKLVDVLAERKHMPLLVRHARQLTADWGLPVLKAWMTSGCADILSISDAEIKPLDIVIPLNTHVAIHRSEDIREKWFLMIGDTEFL